MRTHYQNLKVAEDAPPEVIKAAWRALTQKHHPDRNDAADALRVTQIINDAYEVLSDPSRRQAYDARLAEQRRVVVPAQVIQRSDKRQMPRPQPPSPPQGAKVIKVENELTWGERITIGFVVTVIVLFLLMAFSGPKL